MMMTEK